MPRASSVAVLWLLQLATVQPAAAEPRHDTPGLSSAAALLADGEARLAAGDVDSALQAFEQAAAQQHLAASEISLVRGLLQAGDYRRALALAAHAAGAHPDEPQAAALYAWLLHVGGQPQLAGRVLDSAQTASPMDSRLSRVRERLAMPWPAVDDDLMQPPARFAPYADHELAPAGVVATGTLIDAGTRAVVPAAAIADAETLWLRNGLGRTVRAARERQIQVDGATLVVLRLESPLPMPAELTSAAGSPYAGSVGYAIEFGANASAATPAWPLLQLGFLGRASAAGSGPRLGIALPPGPRGGPVFDQAGRLTGIAVPGPDGVDRLAQVAALRDALGEVAGTAAPGPASPRMAQDELYERALLLALQVIVARGDA